MATREALWNYRNEFGDAFGRTYFRRFGPGVISSIGVGTYLGEPSDAVDDAYRATIGLALRSGINVVDTAPNYRCGRSERVVGETVHSANIDREAVVVSTKAGFLPFDRQHPEDPAAYIREQFVEPGIVDPGDLAAGSHCLDPEYVEWSLDRSLDRLELETIDCLYLHNPETQLNVRSREAVYDMMERCFERLERRRLAGDIERYGVATWDAFRTPPDADRYLSLPAILTRANAAGEAIGTDDDNGFTAIQLPFNVVMADAFTRANQRPSGTENAVSTLEFAHDAGLSVFTSATIAQGDLAMPGSIPARVDEQLAGETSAQRAINFARSAPGVTCSLVGTTSLDHMRETVAAGTFDPLGASAFDAIFE